MRFDSKRNFLINLLKILLGVCLLFLAIWQVDWNVFRDALHSVNVFWLILALASVLIGLTIKVIRWLILLRNFGVILPFKRIFNSYFLGQAANILFFIRSGEVIRIGWLTSSKKEDLAAITASVALEKYLDLVMLVVVMVTVSSNLPYLAAKRLEVLSPLLIVLTIILLAAITGGPWIWQKLTGQKIYSGWKGKFQNKFNRFIQASLWLRSPIRLIPAFAYTIVIWLVMAATNLLLFRALSMNAGWEASGLVLILVYIGVLPALMPGNIGPFTFFAQLALTPFNIETSIALAFAILLYGIVTLPPLLISGLMLLIPKMISKKVFS